MVPSLVSDLLDPCFASRDRPFSQPFQGKKEGSRKNGLSWSQDPGGWLEGTFDQ